MSSDNFKDLTPDDNYASVELTGDSIVLPPDAEDVILVVEGDSSISGTVNVELEHSNDNINFTTAKNKPVGAGAAASYSLSSFSEVAEGGSVTVNLSTTGVDEGVLIPYTITGIQAADLTSGSLTGTMQIGATGNASVTLQPVEDFVAESETMTFTIGSSGNPLDSIDIDILDTSYAITPVATSMDEDSILVFNVSTTNVANGTTLYWTINHGTTAAADFVAESGSFTVTSNAGSFSVQTVADVTTEGSETFTTEVRLGSISGTVAATSSTITINDTSAPAAFGNTKAIESPAIWTLSGGDVTGTTMPTGRIGAYQNTDSTKHLFGGANANGSFSISLWYNQAATPNGGHMLIESVLIDNSNTTASVKFGLMAYTNNQFYIQRAGVAYDANFYGSTISNNVWRHVVVTIESVSGTKYTEGVYIDGVASGGTQNLLKSGIPYLFDMTGYTNYGFSTGGVFDTDANHAPYNNAINSNNMRVDEISTYSKKLSQSEVTAIYNSGVPTDLTGHSGLEHWFRMGDGSTDTGTSIVSQTDSSVAMTSTTDYSLHHTMNSPIYVSDIGNDKYIEDVNRSNAGGTARGNYNKDTSSDGKGWFPDLESSGGFRSSPNVSWSFWMKCATIPANTVNFFYEYYDTDEYLQFGMASSNRLSIYTRDGASTSARNYRLYSIASSVFDGDWHHICITTDSDDVATGATLYLDGVAQTPSATTTSYSVVRDKDTKSIALMGNNFLGAGGSPTIAMDEFSTWKKELTASEVLSLYNNGSPTDLTNHSASTDLQRWFKMGDTIGDGVNIKDSQETTYELASYDSQDNTQDH